MKTFFKIVSLISVQFFFFISCGLFDLRDPEEPASSRSSFVEPFSAEDVPANLAYSFSDGNLSNFQKCFNSESYSFIPSQEFQLELQNLNADDESFIFQGMKNSLIPGERIKVSFTPLPFVPQADSAEWSGEYSVAFPNPNPLLEDFFEGKIILNLKRDKDGLWSVTKWTDISEPEKNSWSLLKLKLAK